MFSLKRLFLSCILQNDVQVVTETDWSGAKHSRTSHGFCEWASVF